MSLLSHTDVEFSFAVQFQEDPAKQKIDELTTEWDTPYYIIAKLIIPKQQLNFKKEYESLVFSPWNSQPDHAPIGYVCIPTT